MKRFLVACVVAGVVSTLIAVGAAAATFSNPAPLNFPSVGAATPYPSPITVSGMSGTISKVTLTLFGLSHTQTADLDMLLSGPTGARIVFLSDAGGNLGVTTGATLTFDDGAANLAPNSGGLVSGTFRPTAWGNNVDSFNTPAPAPSFPADFAAPDGTSSFASAFDGASPNGTWNLYIMDDSAGGVGSLAGGWQLVITTVAATASATLVASSVNPSFATAPGNSVTFTATVTSGGPVTEGTVTFKEGGTTLAGPITLDSSGKATLVTSSLAEGAHTITAVYNGTSNFGPSSGTVLQQVDNHTLIAGQTFSNPGVLNFPSIGSASPYPSHVFVSGLSGTISKLTLTLASVTHSQTADMDLLLVGPSGATLVVLSDVGGNSGLTSGATITLDDAAASLLPLSGGLTGGSYKPTAAAGADGFDTPAPGLAFPADYAAPDGGATLASTFNGYDPNGTWSLYAMDDSAGGAGSISGGWSLTFVTTTDTPTTTTLVSSANPVFSGDTVTLTATVKNGNDGSRVKVGSITFTDGTTILAGSVSLDLNGQASFSTTGLAEGVHLVTASYSGAAGAFNSSSAKLALEVDNHTIVSGNSFCNPGPIIFGSAGSGAPYPSSLFVSGISGTISSLTVTLNNLSLSQTADLNLLLVSPGGAEYVFLSNVGGNVSSTANATLVLSDSAGSLLPLGNGGLASGTYRPTAYGAGVTFVAPAPGSSFPADYAAPAGNATFAAVFKGSDPNGTWKLYAMDDSAGGSGSLAGGWCLTLNTCIAADITGVPSSLCAGSAGNPASGPAGAVGYAWTVSNGNITSPTNDRNITFTAGTSGNVTLTLNVTGPSGCVEQGSVSLPVFPDTVSPSIVCPADMVVTALPGQASATVDFSVFASDNCSVASVVSVPPPLSAFPAGKTTVSSIASDASGNSSSCTFTVTVNRPPTALGDQFATAAGQPLVVSKADLLTNDSDPDGDALSIVAVSASSAHGFAVTVLSNAITYTPGAGFSGSDSFGYTVADGRGGEAQALVQVAVRPPGAPPPNALAIAATSAETRLVYSGVPGKSYLIQFADSPQGLWSDLAGPILIGPAGLLFFQDTTSPRPFRRFYRVTGNP